MASGMNRWLRIFLVASVALLSSCRVDVGIDVAVNPDGSGVLSLSVTADKEVLAQAPGLAEDLRLDDVKSAGWTVGAPAPFGDGGLRVNLSHAFATVDEATTLLSSLNGPSGPLHNIVVTREATSAKVSTSVAGTLRVDGSLQAFADPDLLAKVGATPWADRIAAAKLSPQDAVGITFTARLPGKVEPGTIAAKGTVTAGATTWTVSLDGTPLEIATTATGATDQGFQGWGTISKIAFYAFIGWLVISLMFIAWVMFQRRQRSKRRRVSQGLTG